MMRKILLLFAVFFPTVCAPVSFIIGRRSRQHRNNFVAAVTGLELAAVVLMMVGGEASVRLDGLFIKSCRSK